MIDGGNQSGIPYGRGWELFDGRYLGKPLVFCGTVGSMPVTVGDRPGETKEVRAGDLVVMTGDFCPLATSTRYPSTAAPMFEYCMRSPGAQSFHSLASNGAPPGRRDSGSCWLGGLTVPRIS